MDLEIIPMELCFLTFCLKEQFSFQNLSSVKLANINQLVTVSFSSPKLPPNHQISKYFKFTVISFHHRFNVMLAS